MTCHQAPFEADAVERTLQDLPGKTILVVGDVMLDEYLSGEVRRMCPEAPVPVVEVRSRSCAPGGAANVAANIASLGCRALLGSVVGADEEARQLRSTLDNAGVCGEFLLVDNARPTTLKQRILAQNQQIVRLDREVHVPISASQEDSLLQWVARSVREASACILSDYGKGVATPRVAGEVIALCCHAGIPVLVDPKSLSARSLQGATLVKPNKAEAERLANAAIHDDVSFFNVGRRLAELLDGPAVVVTRGGLGMSLFRRGTDPFAAVTAARNVYDVTGAGDTVIAMLSVAMAARRSLEESVWLSGQLAALSVEKLGTVTVTIEELRARLRQ